MQVRYSGHWPHESDGCKREELHQILGFIAQGFLLGCTKQKVQVSPDHRSVGIAFLDTASSSVRDVLYRQARQASRNRLPSAP